MVDPVAGSAISSLLRAQSASAPAAIVALKSDQQATQAIINQLQNSAAQNKAVSASPSKTALMPASGTLPRGSLVDKLV